MDSRKKILLGGVGCYLMGMLTLAAPKMVLGGLLVAVLVFLLVKLVIFCKHNLTPRFIITTGTTLLAIVIILLLLGFGHNNNEGEKILEGGICPEQIKPEMNIAPAAVEETASTSSENSKILQPRMTKEEQNSKVEERTNPTERKDFSEVEEKGKDSTDVVISEPVKPEEEFEVETPADSTSNSTDIIEEEKDYSDVTESEKDYSNEFGLSKNEEVEPEVESDFTSKDLAAEEEVVNDNVNEASDLEVAPEVKEEKEEVKELSVKALDGYETVIGSSIQFEISDVNATIEGLEGIEYSFTNGILTINVGTEATVLTVQVSNSTGSQTFDITVNGIVR